MEASRAAQVIVERGVGEAGRRGSGYLVSADRVLTAAHVLLEAQRVLVRLDAGGPTEVVMEAASWWADEHGETGTDLAVISLKDRVDSADENVTFGRISDTAAVLSVHALGFPLFKRRTRASSGGQQNIVYRDLEQVEGRVPVAANRRQGTLAINLADPPPAGSWGSLPMGRNVRCCGVASGQNNSSSWRASLGGGYRAVGCAKNRPCLQPVVFR